MTRFHARVEGDLKSKRVEEETKAALLVPDVDVDCVHAQERIGCVIISHCSDYREPAVLFT